MRVLMTGGGTGGHVNPAIAIANTIKSKEPDAQIEFVASTRPNDKACDLVPRAGYKLHKLDICASYGPLDPRNLKTLYCLIKSSAQAKRLIREYKPDVIIGTGGFASFPLLYAGAKLGVPTAVHESNAKPGRAVLKLCRKVDVVLTNFDAAESALSGSRRVVRVGNPTLFGGDKKQTSAPELKKGGFARRVLCFGGSGGAKRINEEMCRILPTLAGEYPDTLFTHASGMRDYGFCKQSYENSGLDSAPNVELVEYIYDMNRRMAEADLLICRAGAMTVSEVALMGKAAIFVPFPYAAANHQYENAKAIADADACELVLEDTFAKDGLADAVRRLLSDGATRQRYAQNIKSFAEKEANENIYREIKALLEK
ncbi:MAG: UDP-N-acetylglucosamine--N-acetylmuramyl-(pentapeptide) pyrophosphoryl-undecaprenol N-acetylglucosamine transferase [Clostridia bacterium]|nr:UDP-N-acetylglucosamine--N-acetylmuramyl-(pentapeptide) pyrophosphoryl-undecaprenol N-acetylglucosamine transferase [Clostridia bacterium]